MEKILSDASIQVGTIRGLSGTAVNLGFFVNKAMNDYEYHAMIEKAILKANFEETKASWENVGLYIGAFFKDMLNV